MATKRKLRPCDCIDIASAESLNEQGIGHNDESITVEPNHVILRMGHTTIKIGMKRFKMFAKWYLEPQEIADGKYISSSHMNSNTSTSG